MLKPSGPRPGVRGDAPDAAQPRCIRFCGVAGYHPTIDACLTAQRVAIAELHRARLTPESRPPPLEPLEPPAPLTPSAPNRGGWPLGQPRTTPNAVIDPATKAIIVARMFEAGQGFGDLMAATRTLGAEFHLKPGTIQTSWRRWATERDPI
jgi:hypothetical protein